METRRDKEGIEAGFQWITSSIGRFDFSEIMLGNN